MYCTPIRHLSISHVAKVPQCYGDKIRSIYNIWLYICLTSPCTQYCIMGQGSSIVDCIWWIQNNLGTFHAVPINVEIRRGVVIQTPMADWVPMVKIGLRNFFWSNFCTEIMVAVYEFQLQFSDSSILHMHPWQPALTYIDLISCRNCAGHRYDTYWGMHHYIII